MRVSRSCGLAVLSAALLALAMPPSGISILAWVGLSPFLLALRRSGKGSVLAASLVFGFVFSSASLYCGRSISTLPIFLLFSFLMGLYFVLFGLAYRLASRSGRGLLFITGPAIWTAVEYLRSNLFFLAFPWALLAYTQHSDLPVIQVADITGVYGVSFFIVMANQAVSNILEFFFCWAAKAGEARRWMLRILAPAAVMGAVLIYGWIHIGYPAGSKTIRVAVIQADRFTRAKMSPSEREGQLRAYGDLSFKALKEKPDLIVWPESSLPTPMGMRGPVLARILKLARQLGTPLVVGAAGYEKMKMPSQRLVQQANSEFLIFPSDGITARYDKMKLVPFFEQVPLARYITWPSWITTLKYGFSPGAAYTLFDVKGAKFATPLCWENLFPDFFRRFVAKGANFMISVTNEAFLGRSKGQYQTLAANVFRAVENRVAVVRCSTTGVSCFINPDGKIKAKIEDSTGKDLFVAGWLVRDVPLSTRKTFYTLHGDLFALASACFALLVILGAPARRFLAARRRRPRGNRGKD